eukprot:GHVH01017020.1.p1 GENE.GHVH01017020.1~~GHVH01017020.1.p1  ORF type:complete len:280 (+),score=60.73 GHVH01017020.1:538-1377(+)
MKYSFTLRKSDAANSSGQLQLNGRGGLDAMNSTQLGFASAELGTADKRLKNVTSFKEMGKEGTFVGETVDEAFATSGRKRKAATAIIHCHKRIKVAEVERSSEGDDLKAEMCDQAFSDELKTKEGGLIVNKIARRSRIRSTAPLLVRMQLPSVAEGGSSQSAVKSDPVASMIKNEASVNRGGDVSVLIRSVTSQCADAPPDFVKVAVKDFGMAMILGMGYDETADRNKPVDMKVRSYARGGLGSDKFFEEGLSVDLSKPVAVEEEKADTDSTSSDESSD